MIIESGYLYRDIASQSEFSFNIVLENSTVTGISKFGFIDYTGKEENFFIFKSGKILDLNNKYVWSYTPREEIFISGNIGNNFINYFINDNPICLYQPFQNKSYNKFFINTSNSVVDFDLYIQGNFPEYEFSFPNIVVDGQNITGYIKNISAQTTNSFRIFSGEISTNNTDFNLNYFDTKFISGGQSGKIVFNSNSLGINSIVDASIDLTLDTNFGRVNYFYPFVLYPGPIFLTEFITGFSGNIGSIENLSLQKRYNFELRSLYPTDRNVSIKIENISGHNNQEYFAQYIATGRLSGNLSNFIYGFDYLTGIISGNFISNSLDYNNSRVSGAFGFSERLFQEATGRINYYYTLPLFGGSGFGPSPLGTKIPASGFLSSSLPIEKFVFGSGKYVQPIPNFSVTGYYFNSININNNVVISGLLKYSGLIILENKDYLWSSHNLTGINFTGFSSRIYGVTGEEILDIKNGVEDYFGIKDSNQRNNLEVLFPIINQTENSLNQFGSWNASTNVSNIKDAFLNTGYCLISGQQGFVTLNLTNYGANKKTISHYGFNLDLFSAKFEPSIFRLEISNNGMNWTGIDTKTNFNFYKNPNFIIKCTGKTNDYNYIRLNFLLNKDFQHINDIPDLFTGIKINNFEIYDSTPVTITGNLDIENKTIIPNNINNYLITANNLPEDSYKGQVIYSSDNINNQAWKAFSIANDGFSQIIKNASNFYLGYQTEDPVKEPLSKAVIEFETDAKPSGLKFQASKDNINYSTFFAKSSDIENIENIQFNKYSNIQNYQYFKFDFNPIDETSFVILGDGNDLPLEDEVNISRSIQSLKPLPEFIIHVGDINERDSSDKFQDVLKLWEESGLIDKIYLAFGNHDLDNEQYGEYILNYLQATNSKIGPTKRAQKRYCYDFIKGPCHFFIVNTGNTTAESNLSSDINAQLNEQLNELIPKIQASTSPWKIFVCHRPPYTNDELRSPGFFGRSGDWANIKSRLNFQQLGIQIVLSGHGHQYSVYFIDNTYFLVNGTGGANRRDVTSSPAFNQTLDIITQKVGYIKCYATKTRFKWEFIDVEDNNNILDTATLTTSMWTSSSSSSNISNISYIVDFEDGTKTDYPSGNVTLRGKQWNMTDVLIGTDVSDFKNGSKSARLRGYSTSVLSMLENIPEGLGTINFIYSRYGGDPQVEWIVEYSINNGSSWVEAGKFTPTSEPRTFSATINNSSNGRVRIRTNTTGNENRRANIDDFFITRFGGTISSSSPSSAYKIYVTDTENNSVSIINPENFQITNILDSNTTAHSVKVNPVNKNVFLFSRCDPQLKIYDKDNNLIRTLNGLMDPNQGVVNSKTNKLYITSNFLCGAGTKPNSFNLINLNNFESNINLFRLCMNIPCEEAGSQGSSAVDIDEQNNILYVVYDNSEALFIFLNFADLNEDDSSINPANMQILNMDPGVNGGVTDIIVDQRNGKLYAMTYPGNLILVTRQVVNNVTTFNKQTLLNLGTSTVGLARGGIMKINYNASELYILTTPEGSDTGEQKIQAINLDNNTLKYTITLPNDIYYCLEFSHRDNKIYVTGKNGLVVVNASTGSAPTKINTIIDKYSIAVDNFPSVYIQSSSSSSSSLNNIFGGNLGECQIGTTSDVFNIYGLGNYGLKNNSIGYGPVRANPNSLGYIGALNVNSEDVNERRLAISDPANGSIGLNWRVTQPILSSQKWEKVIYAPYLADNVNNFGKWIAISKSENATFAIGNITSNGVNWFEVDINNDLFDETIVWKDIAYGNGVLIAIGENRTNPDGGEDRFAYSIDGGTTWAKEILPVKARWSSIIYGNQKFILVNKGGSSYRRALISNSTFGIFSFWSEITLPELEANDPKTWEEIAFGNNAFIISNRGSGKIAKSADGVSWKIISVLPFTKLGVQGPLEIGYNLQFRNLRVGVFVLVTSDSVLYSQNGEIWFKTTIPNLNIIQKKYKLVDGLALNTSAGNLLFTTNYPYNNKGMVFYGGICECIPSESNYNLYGLFLKKGPPSVIEETEKILSQNYLFRQSLLATGSRGGFDDIGNFTITPSTGVMKSIDIKNNIIAVGIPNSYYSPTPGTVYLYTGNPSGGFRLSDTLFGDYAFGNSLTLSKDASTLVVGSPGNGPKNFFLGGETYPNSGSFINIYRKEPDILGITEWRHKQLIFAPDPFKTSSFGTNIKLSADNRILAVSNPGYSTNQFANQGALHIYTGSPSFGYRSSITFIGQGEFPLQGPTKNIAMNDLGDIIVTNTSSGICIYTGNQNRDFNTNGFIHLPFKKLLPSAGFGTNWAIKSLPGSINNQSRISISSDGRYQTITNFNNGIYTSNNYGETWVSKQTLGSPLYSITMTSDGRYQIIGGFNRLYQSTNYGSSWIEKIPFNTNIFYNVSMSSDGRYQIIADITTQGTGGLNTSNNYGETWSFKLPGGQWRSVNMSSNGRYQGAVNNTNIYISNDYGNTWSAKSPTPNILWESIAISADGKYQTAVSFDAYIAKSTDYGNNWSIGQFLGLGDSWRSVAISSDGRYQTIVSSNGYIYTSNDYGANFLINYSLESASTYVAMSTDGKYLSVLEENNNDIHISKDIQSFTNLGPELTNIDMSIDISNSGNIITAAANESICIYTGSKATKWDIAQVIDLGGAFGGGPGVLATVAKHNDVSMNGDGTILTACFDNSLYRTTPQFDITGRDNSMLSIFSGNPTSGWNQIQIISGEQILTDPFQLAGNRSLVNDQGNLIFSYFGRESTTYNYAGSVSLQLSTPNTGAISIFTNTPFNIDNIKILNATDFITLIYNKLYQRLPKSSEIEQHKQSIGYKDLITSHTDRAKIVMNIMGFDSNGVINNFTSDYTTYSNPIIRTYQRFNTFNIGTLTVDKYYELINKSRLNQETFSSVFNQFTDFNSGCAVNGLCSPSPSSLWGLTKGVVEIIDDIINPIQANLTPNCLNCFCLLYGVAGNALCWMEQQMLPLINVYEGNDFYQKLHPWVNNVFPDSTYGALFTAYHQWASTVVYRTTDWRSYLYGSFGPVGQGYTSIRNFEHRIAIAFLKLIFFDEWPTSLNNTNPISESEVALILARYYGDDVSLFPSSSSSSTTFNNPPPSDVPLNEGAFQVAVVSGERYQSKDYGKSWNLMSSQTWWNPLTDPIYNTPISELESKNWSDISLNEDGVIQTLVSKNGWAYVSTNAGQSFEKLKTQVWAKNQDFQWINFESNSPKQFQKIIQTKDGNFRIIIQDNYLYINNITAKLFGDSKSVLDLFPIYKDNIYSQSDPPPVWKFLAFGDKKYDKSATFSMTLQDNDFRTYISNDDLSYNLSYAIANVEENGGRSEIFYTDLASENTNTFKVITRNVPQRIGGVLQPNPITPINAIKPPFTDACISESGHYINVISQSVIGQSNDYGQNWRIAQFQGSDIYGRSIAMSAKGQYQMIAQEANVIKTGSGPNDFLRISNGGILRSDDFGLNFQIINATTGEINGFKKVSMSVDGKYITALPSASGQIYRSEDYGVTWGKTGPIKNWASVSIASSTRDFGDTKWYISRFHEVLYKSKPDENYINTIVNAMGGRNKPFNEIDLDEKARILDKIILGVNSNGNYENNVTSILFNLNILYFEPYVRFKDQLSFFELDRMLNNRFPNPLPSWWFSSFQSLVPVRGYSCSPDFKTPVDGCFNQQDGVPWFALFADVYALGDNFFNRISIPSEISPGDFSKLTRWLLAQQEYSSTGVFKNINFGFDGTFVTLDLLNYGWGAAPGSTPWAPYSRGIAAAYFVLLKYSIAVILGLKLENSGYNTLLLHFQHVINSFVNFRFNGVTDTASNPQLYNFSTLKTFLRNAGY